MDSPIDVSVLLTQLDYSAWATGLLLQAAAQLTDEEAARNLQASHGGVLDTLRHVYWADRIWLARFEGTSLAPKEMPEPSIADLLQKWPELFAKWRELIGSLPPQQLADELHYRNTKGEPFALERWKLVLHVVNHGTLHRGQVMSMLRQLGQKPPATDLIFYYLTTR